MLTLTVFYHKCHRRGIESVRLIHTSFLLLLLMASGGVAADSTTKPLKIILPPIEQSSLGHLSYFPRLLELALIKTEAIDGPFNIVTTSYLYTSARTIAELKYGRSVNVIWTSPSDDREKELLPIRISLLHGLNSYRVFLIRKEDQKKFNEVRSLNDLRNFKAGSVSNWPDTKVMRNSDLSVVTSAHYNLLFVMLAGKRFDYFPRGLYEVWDEQRVHADKDLVVEETLMFHYPAPIYFFVNRKDIKLADRIERGLKIAIEDGSFMELFLSFPGFRKGHEELSNKNRRIFDLNDQQAPLTPTL